MSGQEGRGSSLTCQQIQGEVAWPSELATRAVLRLNTAILGTRTAPHGGSLSTTASLHVSRIAGRYVDAELPRLPFENGAFGLALCTHLLFLYSTQLGETFHRAALHEMCRVAAEVRVFPLLALGGERSPFIDQCVRDLAESGYQVLIERVRYEFLARR